jgi:octaprenyl-diphosphate synthase
MSTGPAPASSSSCAAIIEHLPLVRRCRRQALRLLDGAPNAPLLVRYFELGKLVRPLLTLLSASAVGADVEEVEAGAIAVEFLHCASLIHDDIIDHAIERRGLPALHMQVGQSVALVLGDYMLLRAFSILLESRTALSQERVSEALTVLAAHAQECCRGEIDDVTAPMDSDEETIYLEIVRKKTASTFAAAASVGAILGGGTEKEVRSLKRYGVALGMAFQIRDDILDLVGESGFLGKPAGNSLALGRPLLPLIYLRQTDRTFTSRRVGRSAAARRRLLRLLEKTGALARTKRLESQFLAEALDALDALKPSRATDALLELPSYALEASPTSAYGEDSDG